MYVVGAHLLYYAPSYRLTVSCAGSRRRDVPGLTGTCCVEALEVFLQEELITIKA